MSYRVIPQQLLQSGYRVTGESDNIALAYASADKRTQNAQDGWAGASAEALTELATAWRSRTASLVERLNTHADAFLVGAQTYQEAEANHARTLAEVGDAGDQVSRQSAL